MNIHPKIIAQAYGTGYGGALAFVLVWALNTYAHADIPPEVGIMIGTLFSGAIGFISGYMKPSTPTPKP